MQTKNFHSNVPFTLESGQELPEIELTYTTYGRINAAQDNVIWIIHALTGDSRVGDWWNGMVGEDKFFDPADYFIICVNLLGSCYGSTSPLSQNPKTGKPYFYDFPLLTTRDMAKSLDLVRESIGIKKIHTLLGGSLGGQVALEWAYQLGDSLEKLVILASTAKSSPWVIGFNESQRMAIESDCTWGEENPDAGKKGLETARAIAMLSYRHPSDFARKQESPSGMLDNFRAASYLRYQGQKLAKRFTAFSYWILSKAMDNHDLGRNRDSYQDALKKIKARTLAVGVNSDLLFLPEESLEISRFVPKGSYREIQSTAGHDAFLIEFEQLHYILKSFYVSTESRN
ncbi:MAG: homoserine O-acetyltransferase [Algoriphagus sp.]|uniref:homoserine O-acetyltransferase family protein n=1 Tax=Algoriphagus sp. TaxID=1872435 RepID=UPI0017C37A53|nr:homoserine O-acetyltransferase [Algoriphagus sp.]NVJ86195.1 homoserine O-acetyltransferase [Algoriphagus sp.]